MNFSNFVTDFSKFVFFADIKIFSHGLESLNFPTFSENVVDAKFEQRQSWEIEKLLWKRHGNNFCKVCGNPDI